MTAAWTLEGSSLVEMVVLAASVAASLLLFLLHMRASMTRTRQMRAVRREVKRLKAANQAIASAFEDAKKNVADIALVIARKSEAQEKRVVGELKALESRIRAVVSAAREKARAETTPPPSSCEAGPGSQAGGGPEPPRPETGSDSVLLEAVRRALEANRVDLCLQPVVGLPQRKLRFHEALTRLRSEDGTLIMPAQYIRIAAPAGLMSVVDNLLLFRCVQMMRRLTRKHRDIGVFCNISGHTLADAECFAQFLDFMHHHRELSSHLIFEFPQGAILSAGLQEQANLRYLSGLGFRLSLDQVTKLDVDFTLLKRLGFQFVKVAAGTLLSGMEKARAPVAAEDFKELLARNGLGLIAERVEDERTVVQLLDLNVELAQGFLFGRPRPLRDFAEADAARPSAPARRPAKASPAPLAR